MFAKMLDRFDISFTGVNSSQQGPGHMSGSTGPSGNAPFGGMTAMLDTHVEFVDYNCWFPDSRAINHVTNELGNLSISSEYTWNGKIHRGNATGLPIFHIGHTSF